MKERLFTVRVMMTIASLTPLFVLAAIRGFGTVVSDRTMWIGVVALIAVPNAIVTLRLWRARTQKDQAHLEVESATDNREHLLVYLFAVLMPLYQSTFSSPREVIANVVVFVFVIYLFMHMHLHYMNVIFAIVGYRVFTVESKGRRVILLTKRTQLTKGDTLAPYRLSNTVYFEG